MGSQLLVDEVSGSLGVEEHKDTSSGLCTSSHLLSGLQERNILYHSSHILFQVSVYVSVGICPPCAQVQIRPLLHPPQLPTLDPFLLSESLSLKVDVLYLPGRRSLSLTLSHYSDSYYIPPFLNDTTSLINKAILDGMASFN